MTWKRKIGWLAIILVATIVTVGIAGHIVVRSQKFHDFLLTQIQQRASESTGAQVRIQNLALHLSTLAADAYGITIRGNETASAQPLAQADQLTVRVRIVSLLRKKIDLNEIVLRHPVVNLIVKKDGSTNLPTPPKLNRNGSTNPFDLGIQHVLLEKGEIYYNDVKTPLNAELHDLRLEVKSGLLGKSYDGSVSYRDGRIRYGNSKALPHDLTASFNASPSDFTLKPLVLTVASSTLELQGKVENYTEPSVNAAYKLTIHPQDAGPVVNDSSIPAGEFTMAGSLRYRYQANVPALHSLILDGRLYGRELTLNQPELHTAIRNIRGQFKLVNGNLDAHGIEADVLDGHVSAAATAQHIDANPRFKSHTSLQAISLGAAKAAVRTANLNHVPIDGHIDGIVDAEWTGNINNIQARADVALKAAVSGAPAEPTAIPVDGSLHLNYQGRSSVLTLTDTFVRTPQTRVDVSGTAGQKLDLKVRTHAADLAELDSLAAGLQNASASSSTSARRGNYMNLAGSADLQLSIDGNRNDPRIHGQLTGRNLQVENTQWRSLDSRLEASKSELSLRDGSLVNANQGHINFAFRTALSNWDYSPSNSIALELNSRDLAIHPLLQFARMDYPVFGNISMDVSMKASGLSPEGTASIRLVQAKIYGEPLQQLAVQVKGNGNALTSSLEVNMPAGSAKANLVLYPKNKGYKLDFDAPAIKLAQLQSLQERNVGIDGVLTATARGRGTLDDPQLTATMELPELRVHQTSISKVKADLSMANHKAEVALGSEVAQTSVQAHGTVDLSPGHYTHAALDTHRIPVEGLLALFAPAKTNGPRGIIEVHMSGEGPLDDMSRMQAQVTIPTLKAEYQGLQIANTHPIQIHYANSIIALDPAEITGTDTTVRLQGQLPLQGTSAATLSAVGSVDLQLLRFFQPDLQSSGKLLLDVRATRVADHPALTGQLRLQNISLITPDAPLGLHNLNGVLDVRNDQITITQLAGEAGGGQISARGVIGYRPRLQMNVAVQGKGVRIRYQDAIRSVLDSDLNLVGTSDAGTLSGRVLVDSLSFTQNFDLATFAGQVQSGPEVSSTPGPGNKVKLDITVQTARDLNLTSSAVSLQGQANLRIVGTAADPVVVGRTEFTAGDIFLMNKRYQIERGIIQFSNPNRTEPVLNVLLTSTINQYNLSLSFRGPLDKLQTSYVSDPQLPTADIINLVARGQTAEQAATSPSNLGASSLLAQGAASEVSSGVQKLTGLSSLSIDPTLGGNNSDPGARIAMQKRVTNNFLFTFATDVTSAQREIIQGEYRFNKRWSGSVTRDENGGFAVDGKYHKRF